MSLRPYPNYKPSDVAWIGEVPADWRVVPLATVAKVINGYPFDAGLFSPDDGYPLIRIRDLGKIDTQCRYAGDFIAAAAITSEDVLIGMDGDFNVGRWMGAGEALLNQRLCCVRGSAPTVTRLLEYALAQPLKAINAVTYSTTVKHLSSLDVKKIRLPIPSHERELLTLVEFLDRETGKIDALVEEQKRLIELLKEKRQAVITHAVTKGLDPNVPMKPSGVEWLGDVPEHWVVTPIRHVARLESGHTPSRSRPEWWEDCMIPWFTLADIWQVREQGRSVITETKEKVSELGLANSSARLLPQGTVMLSRTASVGFAAIAGVDMATTQDFANWVCGSKLNNEFLLWTFRAMRPEFARLMMGSTHNTIYMPDIASFRFALPPMEEQAKVTRHLHVNISKLDALISDARALVTLLQERRSALISAAVTGKIDVRELNQNDGEAA